MTKIRDRRTGFSGKRWPQIASEMDEFVDLLKAEGVRSYLEVGALYGDTFHAVGMALPEGSRLVAVDLPGHKRGVASGKHRDSAEYLERAAEDLRQTRGHEVHVYIGNSRDTEIVQAARALAPYDAILIDGDHTPEGCLADWENYGPMGRIVAFHDISGEKYRADVRKVFHEARDGKRWREVVSGEPKGGIGVL